MSIQFIDLQAQRRRIGEPMTRAILDAVEGGAWVMGPQVRQFEADMAAFGRAGYALGCANGTDALALPLMVWGIGPGDAIFCPSFTFAATGEVAPWFGAENVFVDIDPATYNMDPAHLEASIQAVIAEGRLTPRVVIAVDLFGQPADYPKIREICDRYGLKLIADTAQGFGCTLDGKHPVHWADIATTSFFPAKPLGCYGDGGAVLTNDAALAELIDSVCVHGKAVASDLQGRFFDHDRSAGVSSDNAELIGLTERMLAEASAAGQLRALDLKQVQIAGRALNAAAGQDAAAAATRMAGAAPAVAGSLPTAAQVAENGGIAALERSVASRQPADFTQRAMEQSAARLQALRGIAGDDVTMAASVAARKAATDPMYAQAKAANYAVDQRLESLLNTPAMQQATSSIGTEPLGSTWASGRKVRS